MLISRSQKFLIILVLATSIFFRFYKINQTAPFLGDQGRDLFEIRESIAAGRLPLVGPESNFGIHAGPIYYYLAIPPLILTSFNPLGPIIFFTFFGVVSSFLIFLIAKNLFGIFPAFFASLLYACSPAIVNQSLGFWNPIPIPLFSLLIIFSIYQIRQQKNLLWLIPLGIFSGIVIQFYPPALYVLVVVGLWLFSQRLSFNKWALVGLVGFILTLVPFLLFQFQNDFSDIKSLLLLILEKFFFSAGQNNPDQPLIQTFRTVFASQFQSLTAIPFWPINLLLGVIIVIFSLKNYWSRFLSLWLLGGILLISFYPGTIHEHYASPIWAIPFLIFASFLNQASKHLPKRLIFGFALLLVCWQIYSYFQNFSPTNDLTRTQSATKAIIDTNGNQPFSLLLFSSKSPSDAHLRYLLSLKNVPLQKTGTTKQLFVVCENNPCPEPKTVQNLKLVDSECLPTCPPLNEQKTINLSNWQYLSSEPFSGGGKIYLFER